MSMEPQMSRRGARAEAARIDGVLNINKPEGGTSMDVVRRIKRSSNQKRVGHGGTLDPFASGVIPICLGQATRTMEYLIEGTKAYRAVVELGVETDTYDVQGTITGRSDASNITLRELEAAKASFEGTIEQVPPMYSALKRQGKRLYVLARAGVEVERPPRQVEVMGIDVLSWASPLLEIEVRCGRGLYVRSLAHDLGQSLGCGGHLKSLVRLKSGPFHLADALSLEEAELSFEDGTWSRHIQPTDIVVGHLRAAIVGERTERIIRQGQPVPPGLRIQEGRKDERCRVYTTDGRFLAIISFNPAVGQWQPHRVFNLP
jgi:tRNA pseudouridine55 synthase